MVTTKEYTVSEEESGQRLDVFCVNKISGQSRAALQKAIKEGEITINNEVVKPKQIVHNEDIVRLNISEVEPITEVDIESVNIPIIYEDKDVVVVNKPAGISVHPGQGVPQATISQWFANRYPQSSEVGDPGRPGIVHRLDKDTSGVLIIAKTKESFDNLKMKFKKRRVKKEYLALVFGVPGGPDGRITRPLLRSKRNPLRRTVDEDGKEAITEWRIEEKFDTKFALIRAYPVTGRMHQIRVHMHFIAHPIVGDSLYTFKRQRPPRGVSRQLLHAHRLTLTLPSDKRKTFEADLPEDFSSVLEKLRHAI